MAKVMLTLEDAARDARERKQEAYQGVQKAKRALKAAKAAHAQAVREFKMAQGAVRDARKAYEKRIMSRKVCPSCTRVANHGASQCWYCLASLDEVPEGSGGRRKIMEKRFF